MILWRFLGVGLFGCRCVRIVLLVVLPCGRFRRVLVRVVVCLVELIRRSGVIRLFVLRIVFVWRVRCGCFG